MVLENHQKYGLPQSYIDSLELPKAQDIKVFDISKVLNPRKKLSTSEKIQYLEKIREVLVKKLAVIKQGRKVEDFDYKTPKEFYKDTGMSREELYARGNACKLPSSIVNQMDQSQVEMYHKQVGTPDLNSILTASSTGEVFKIMAVRGNSLNRDSSVDQIEASSEEEKEPKIEEKKIVDEKKIVMNIQGIDIERKGRGRPRGSSRFDPLRT